MREIASVKALTDVRVNSHWIFGRVKLVQVGAFEDRLSFERSQHVDCFVRFLIRKLTFCGIS